MTTMIMFGKYFSKSSEIKSEQNNAVDAIFSERMRGDEALEMKYLS